jgi:hypothetical protein
MLVPSLWSDSPRDTSDRKFTFSRPTALRIPRLTEHHHYGRRLEWLAPVTDVMPLPMLESRFGIGANGSEVGAS